MLTTKSSILLQKEPSSKEPVFAVLDVTDHKAVTDVINRLTSTLGHIDVVICNAGVSSRGEVKDTSLDVDRQVMDVNYFGQVDVIKRNLDLM